MKKSSLYRVSSALLAAVMLFTCMPQTGLYVSAQEAEASVDSAAPPDGSGQNDAGLMEEPSADEPDKPETDEAMPEDPDVLEEKKPMPDNPDVPEGGETTPDNPDVPKEDEPTQVNPDASEGDEPTPDNPDAPKADELPSDENQEPEESIMPAADGTGADAEKKDFSVDFNTWPIKAKDKTYDNKKHSISGYPLWQPQEINLSVKFHITGETKDGASYEKTKTVAFVYNSVSTEFAKTYDDIAPMDCGSYTLEITVNTDNIDADQYNIPDSGLEQSFHFKILPLQKAETKITGIPIAEQKDGKLYIADKVYDGKPYDLSKLIRDAKVCAFPKDDTTGIGIDITNVAAPLKFCIVSRTSDSDEENSDSGKDKFELDIDRDNINVNAMPKEAGEYELHVSLTPDDKKNYVANEAVYYFAITKQALTITVNDQEMHVGDEGLKANEALPKDRFPEQYQVEGLLDADKDRFSNTIQIVPTQAIDASQTGAYAHVLVVKGIDVADWSGYDMTWNDAGLTVKGQLHQVQSELKAVTNVPNGTSLEQIAQTYLPKRAVIYLYNGGRAPAVSGASEALNDSDGSDSSETPDPTDPDNPDTPDVPDTPDTPEKPDTPSISDKPDIRDTAEVKWDTTRPVQGSYDVSAKTEQKFKMRGTVILPDLVYADADTPLTVEVSVSVREAYESQALRPYADIPSGTVGAGTRVSLFTEEPGAQIWYTTDASDPATSKTSRLYSSPIEIRNTMTLMAVTRVYGKKDSGVLRREYYYNKNLVPGGNEDPDEPEVPDEDIPKDENGKPLPIPDDLWVTDVEKYVYTGKAIKPEVRVYDYKKRLEEKKDYTISYKNNVNAADKNHPSKAPTITITGKGNYEGKLLKTFTIEPKNINDPDVKADYLTVAFNNKAQKPAPTVTWNGKKLSNKKDYSFDATPYTAPGEYKIALTGAGNYTGKREITFTITNGVPVSKLTVSKIPAQTYSGEAFTPEPTVKYGKEVLEKNRDYDLSYEDNVEVGTASIIITGKSRFAGVKRVTFSIKEAALMNKAKITMQFSKGTMYTGKEITADAYAVTVSAKVNGVTQVRELKKDEDYKVTYQNNIKAGTATAVFEGINAYRGTKKQTFKIAAYDLQTDPNKKLDIQAAETYPYMKGGSTQKPVVKFDGKTLTEGTDYTLSYKSHTAAGNYAVMTIKGKGNFKGNTTRSYLVEVQNLSAMKVMPADKVYQAKANIYKTTVRVYDTNGKQLSAGKDYDKNVVYTYAALPKDMKIVTANNEERKVGDVVAATDIIPYGTKIKVTVKAAGSNYQGTAEGIYSITRADIAKAKVTVPQQTYTGKPIELKETDISVTMGGMPVSSEEYKIISYTNNVNKGTAKLTIQGQGNYGGTKTVSFKIKGKSLFKLFG